MEESNNKLKTIFWVALAIVAMLIVGGMDNDYNEQRNRPKEGCREVRISATATICE